MRATLKLIPIFVCCILLLTACSAPDDATVSSAPHADEASRYISASADESGNIVIDTTGITENASYINYESDGVTIQLIAVRGSDGEIRVSFNTCQACTPSPRAYFVQNGNQFICQNCLNAFAADQLGLEHGGCNPTPILEKTASDGCIAIPADYLDQHRNNFSNWQGPTA